MKRFLIHVNTYWCGMDNTFRAEEEGYDPDEMEDSDWDKLWEEYGGEIYGKEE